MRFILCHAIMHLLSLVNTSSYDPYIYLALVSTALLVLVGEAAYPPICFTLALCHGCRLPIGFVFTGCIPNTLDFQIEFGDSAPFLRVSLFDFLCLIFSQRRLQKWSEYFLSLAISVQAAGFFLLPNIIDVHCSCLWVSDI